LIKEYKINATPNYVIVRGGHKETFVGGADIFNPSKGYSDRTYEMTQKYDME